MTVKEHYENHLAGFYSWMMGEFSAKCAVQENYFRDNGLLPRGSGTALDLGAGNGIQSVPLARLGFKVYSVDFNEQLLNELQTNAAGLDIITAVDDIANITAYRHIQPELIVCAGDTIAHLESAGAVNNFIRLAADILSAEGRIYLSFRDYGYELKDTARFIPVKNDDNMILTCFLEYDPQSVRVTDILYRKTQAGWKQEISSYLKTRITAQFIKESLTMNGFIINNHQEIDRIHHIIAEKK